MQVKAITVNATGMVPGWGIQGNMPQAQPEKNGFGPECKVSISQEGKDLSRQQTERQAEKSAQGTQNVETQKTWESQQEEYVGLKKSIADRYKKMGYYGDELRELTESTYEKYCQGYPAGHGGIQQVPFEDPTDEERAAMEEMARKSRETFEAILKKLTPADFANAIPLTFDYVATLPDMPESGSQQ